MLKDPVCFRNVISDGTFSYFYIYLQNQVCCDVSVMYVV